MSTRITGRVSARMLAGCALAPWLTFILLDSQHGRQVTPAPGPSVLHHPSETRREEADGPGTEHGEVEWVPQSGGDGKQEP
jgi:hypothetical protein